MDDKPFMPNLKWKSVKEYGFPKPDQRVVLHCEAIYTGEYRIIEGTPKKGQWLVDKDTIKNVTRWAEIDEESYEKIKKEYW